MTTSVNPKQNGSASTRQEPAAATRPAAQLQAVTVVKIFAFGLITGILLPKLDWGVVTKVDNQPYPPVRVHAVDANKPLPQSDQADAARSPAVNTIQQQPAVETAQVVAQDPAKTGNENGGAVILLTERVKSLEQRLQDHDRQADVSRLKEAEKIIALREQLDRINSKRQQDQQATAELDRLNRQLHGRIAHSQETIGSTRPSVQTMAGAAPVPPPEVKATPLQEGQDAYTTGHYAVAVTTLKPLAEQGDPTARYLLGMMYRNGQGVLANNDTARAWMLKSARQGDPDAQVALAKFYADGINGVKDPFLAYTWYLVAEKNGRYDLLGARDGLEARLQREMLTQAAGLAEQLHNEEHGVTTAATVAAHTATTDQ